MDKVKSGMAGEEVLEFIQHYLLSASCMPATVLGSRDVSLNNGENVMDVSLAQHFSCLIKNSSSDISWAFTFCR